jgi:hypothetical protein
VRCKLQRSQYYDWRTKTTKIDPRVIVLHHSAERLGNHHICKFNSKTQKCACKCDDVKKLTEEQNAALQTV